MTQSASLAVGLIGAGRIGRIHAENLATRIPGARIAAVADIDLQAAQKIASRFNVRVASREANDLLQDPSIPAVAICSATDSHSRLIMEAAREGKHIFCEKPIDFDLGRIDQALEAVERAGVRLQIGFNRRFDPSFRKVRELVAAGEIGQPHLLRITSRDPEPPPIEYVKVSGGLFLDMTIHDFDMSRFLLGSEVEEVYAAAGVLVDPAIGEAGDLDTALVTLRFANGAIGAIDNSRRAVYGYDQRVEVFGSTGMVAAGNETPDRHVLLDATGVHGPRPVYFFLERYQESYLAEMQSFVSCVRNGGEPEVSGRDGRIPVVMGLAARKSYDERRPVKLSEIPGAA
ncbi:MAG TPA: inositol 2-dehydrogenase [Anaerolineales bacterium]